eukprot:Skav221914  [mRNA]  locus=scaffold3084:91404:93296:+ [translate_table: standard]
MKDKHGHAQKPLIETVIADLEQRDHHFVYTKTDARDFLLPQRRTRVFGCSIKQRGQTTNEMEERESTWKQLFSTLGMASKEQSFSLDEMLEKGLDPQPLQATQDIKNWKVIMSKAEKAGKDPGSVCMHLGSSEGRLEWATQCSTCIRPSHDIYCGRVERTLVPCELLRLQGVWDLDFERPEALSDLPTLLARDMAGNAFPTTVLQANLISSLVAYAPTWLSLSSGDHDSEAPPPGPACQDHRGTKRKAKKSFGETTGGPRKKAKQNIRSKRTPPGQRTASGTKSTKKGKKGNKGDCISISKKIALIEEFNTLKASGSKKPNEEPRFCHRHQNA